MLPHRFQSDKGDARPASTESVSTAKPADSGTVNRVLRLLSCFAEQDRWGVNDLARVLNLPKATTHRLLSLCKPLNFVAQDDDGLYQAGFALYRLAGRLAEEMPLNQLAEPILRNVRDRTDETVILALLDRAELQMYFSLSASPAHPLRYTIVHNRLQPLSWGATARSLMAFLTPAEVDEVIRRAEPSPLNGNALDPQELRHALESIRSQGYALSYAERAPEAHGIAVPFFDRQGEIRGNLTLTVPDFRFDQAKLPQWLALLKEGVDELTSRLGWS
ncbi:IclR family transcriptional regulator [Bordetella sp. 15P40C-2]|uniref:IclR family transcriptional regulator n=1 Tax=Bordetella sp. 15P40C-2 TaxID=2572246 RepID=UPI0013247962|nr:IclR family transcriptional regulator [Bordetella sp. 15P40C-2]MVW72839.1 helix-turn-helix domain-containing protein [Bordetella sp. 15P40C-2]